MCSCKIIRPIRLSGAYPLPAIAHGFVATGGYVPPDGEGPPSDDPPEWPVSADEDEASPTRRRRGQGRQSVIPAHPPHLQPMVGALTVEPARGRVGGRDFPFPSLKTSPPHLRRRFDTGRRLGDHSPDGQGRSTNAPGPMCAIWTAKLFPRCSCRCRCLIALRPM